MYDKHLSNVGQIKVTATSAELIAQLQSDVRIWAKQMEKVLTQFQQLRRENELAGPTVEIEYWRRQLARFTSIVEFINSDVCKSHLQCLTLAASKIIKVYTRLCPWRSQIKETAKNYSHYILIDLI